MRDTVGGPPRSPNDYDLVDGYRVHMIRRNLAGTTISRRVSNLWCFARWVEPRTLAEVTPEDVDVFLDERALAPKSRYCWVSTIDCFYAWAKTAGRLDANPVEAVDRPRLPRNLPRPIGTVDLASAVAAATGEQRCWLLLMAYAGLRCKEVALLERADICDTWDPPTLLVRNGKGGHQRAIPLHHEVIAALRGMPMPRAGRLWFRSPKSISKTTNHHLQNVCGLDANAHQLRHWFGTATHRASKDIRLVQELMGHMSPATTAGYALVTMADAVPVVAGLDIRG